MFPVLEAPLDLDLSQFSRLLWQRKLPHRIQTLADRQVLLVNAPPLIPQAQALFEAWRRGEVQPTEEKGGGGLKELFDGDEFLTGFFRALVQSPLTLVLILACVVLAWLAPLARPTEFTFALLYPDFGLGTRTIVLERVLQNLGPGELLRMVSPILLHGGLLHLTFNMLWVWELGRRIERAQGSLVLGATIVVLALISNTAQYLYGGGNNFGGMSGVVYGLFAYIWMWQLFDPRKGLALPGSLIMFMLISLGVMTFLGLSMIANEAHMGGFLAGVVYGALTATISRVLRAAQP